MRERFDYFDEEGVVLPTAEVSSRRESVQKALANADLAALGAELEAGLEWEWPEDPFIGSQELQIGPYVYRYYYNETGYTGWVSAGDRKPFYNGPQER